MAEIFRRGLEPRVIRREPFRCLAADFVDQLKWSTLAFGGKEILEPLRLAADERWIVRPAPQIALTHLGAGLPYAIGENVFGQFGEYAAT